MSGEELGSSNIRQKHRGRCVTSWEMPKCEREPQYEQAEAVSCFWRRLCAHHFRRVKRTSPSALAHGLGVHAACWSHGPGSAAEEKAQHSHLTGHHLTSYRQTYFALHYITIRGLDRYLPYAG
jgi:hypothetical protein